MKNSNKIYEILTWVRWSYHGYLTLTTIPNLFYIQSDIYNEIDLIGSTVAECSSKIVNLSFQVSDDNILQRRIY